MTVPDRLMSDLGYSFAPAHTVKGYATPQQGLIQKLGLGGAAFSVENKTPKASRRWGMRRGYPLTGDLGERRKFPIGMAEIKFCEI